MENPSIMSHVSVGANDLDRMCAFYDAVLATIGAKRIIEHDEAVAYGKMFPEFWVNTPLDNGSAETGNGIHFAFFATDRGQVDAFHAAGLAGGATDNGAPGPRKEYGEPYYGCYLLDPEGNKIEAVFWDAEWTGQS